MNKRVQTIHKSYHSFSTFSHNLCIDFFCLGKGRRRGVSRENIQQLLEQNLRRVSLSIFWRKILFLNLVEKKIIFSPFYQQMPQLFDWYCKSQINTWYIYKSNKISTFNSESSILQELWTWKPVGIKPKGAWTRLVARSQQARG